jgi:NAD(P)-dependent dehydrogenase (short-subunit alcohol dehydrogenase family)
MLGAAAVGFALTSRRPRYDFENKVVLITGGSRGLGLVLARQLAGRGALIGLLARDALELARARRTIPSQSLVQLLPGDVTQPSQVEQAVKTLVQRFGRIDVVINNAGQILSAPFDDTTDADFKALLDVHLWGTLHVTRATLPFLEREGGRIINICSIGGRIPVPHLSAYCASKFAQVGLSEVMAEELRAKGIRVTTILPGLMRTGSHRQAWFKGHHAGEYGMFSLIGGLPITSMGAERAARLILRAAAHGDAEAIIPFAVRQIAKAASMLPNTAIGVMAAANRVLPGPGSKFPMQGRQVGLRPAVAAAVTLSERAAQRNNEV